MGEEDEVSIKEAADMVVKAMDFSGDIVVSFSLRDVLHTVYTCEYLIHVFS